VGVLKEWLISSEQIQWPRVFAEGVLIVGSILLAFGIEAAWDVRGQRHDASSRLSAVRAELEGAGLGYNNHLSTLALQDSLIAELLLEVASYSDVPARLDTLLFRLGPPSSYLPPLTAYDDATGSSGFPLITSQELREALTGYQVLIDNDQREQERLADHYNEREDVVWMQYMNARDSYDVASGSAFFSGDSLPDLPLVSFESDYRGLLADRRFANGLVMRTLFAHRVRRGHIELIEAIEDLRQLIDSP